MLLDVSVQELFAEIGHDGSGERPGHHPQEFLSLAESRGKVIVYYELMPRSQTMDTVHSVWDPPSCYQRFMYLLATYDCVITGVDPDGNPHAWAWCRAEQKVYDPARASEETKSFAEYEPQYVFVARAVQS